MRSIVIGSIAAAVFMFFLGFVFFGLLFPMALSPIPGDAAAAAQAALGANLPASGTYMLPMDEEAWLRGPSALVAYAAAGQVPGMEVAMPLGFAHFLASALLIALALRAVGGDAGRQMRAVLWFGIAAAFFTALGDPIWYGQGWRMPLFMFVADGLIFIAGGLVLARWFTSQHEAARAEPTAVPAQ